MSETEPDTSFSSPTGITAPVKEIKLTPFCATDAPTWFKRAEVHFRLKAETSTTRKADHVLAAIPDDVFPLLSEWLDERGDTPIKYEDLKAHLLKEFVPAPEERACRLLRLTRQPLGDQRPSAAFKEMKALTRLPADATGTPRRLDLLRILWLMRLPECVRANITDFTDVTEEELLTRSDALHNSSRAAENRPVFSSTNMDAPPTTDEDDIVAASSNPRFNYSSRSSAGQRPQRPPSHYQHPSRFIKGNAPRKTETNSFCFYHAKFGDAAKKCRAPCSWPKNV